MEPQDTDLLIPPQEPDYSQSNSAVEDVRSPEPQEAALLLTPHPPGTSQAVTEEEQNIYVQCKICKKPIYIENRISAFVVKCYSCREATPIRPAPSGKKFLRCPCNCLIICSAPATVITCPRVECSRIIVLTHKPFDSSTFVRDTADCPIRCAHCSRHFYFNPDIYDTLAKCPYCRGRSSVDFYAENKTEFWGWVTIIGVIASMLLIWLAAYFNRPLYYVLWLICPLVTASCSARMLKYAWFTKTSTVLRPT